MYSANPFYPTRLHRPTLVDAELHNTSTDNATQHNCLLLSSSSLLSAPPCHCDQHHWGCLHLQPDSDIRWLIWLAHWLLSDFRSMISVIRQRQAAASRDRKWRHEHQRSWYVGYLGGRSLWWKEKEAGVSIKVTTEWCFIFKNNTQKNDMEMSNIQCYILHVNKVWSN